MKTINATPLRRATDHADNDKPVLPMTPAKKPSLRECFIEASEGGCTTQMYSAMHRLLMPETSAAETEERYMSLQMNMLRSGNGRWLTAALGLTTSTTLAQALGHDPYWINVLDKEVLSLPVASVCGAACLRVVLRAELFLSGLVDAAVEDRLAVHRAAAHQTSVSYFG